MHVDTRRKEATNNFPLSAGDWYRQSQQPQWQLERHQNAERGGKMGEDAYEASPSLFSLTFSRALQSASRDFSSNSPTQKARTLPVMDCHLIAAVDSFTHSGWRDGGRGEEEKRRRIFFFLNFFFTRNLRTYSGAPIWIPSLCRRELGGIEPDQRGEGLRHPVGDHRHGAEHDADLQQRHRHLFKRFAFLGEGGKDSFTQKAVFILQTPGRNKAGESWCPARLLAASPGTPDRMLFFWTSPNRSVRRQANELDARRKAGERRPRR